ncbi:MAG: extracellular solute-binding protein [Lachnospiraceae bacterium]|nr:extracellular solute-binding protein [Lachnospiraceae bacterium]
MKKRNLQKLVATLLVGVMAMGCFAGCGEKEDDNKRNADLYNEVAGIEGYTAFKDQVTLQIPVYNRGAQGIDPVTDNGYVDYVQKNFGDKYNIKMEFVPITRSDVMTDYALLASTNNIPTILMEYDYPKVTQWAEDGYLQTVDLDLFANIAPTYYQRMVDLNQLAYTKINSDTYFVLAERPYYDTTYTHCTFVRMDWLKQVGINEVPKSYAEYCTAMDKIIEAGIAKHPAGGTMVTAAYVANFGFRDYPVDEAEWAQHSSLGTPSFSWEATRRLIKRANSEYNKGYTDPEYYITDAETAKAKFINGETYSYGGYMSASVDWLKAFYAANPDAELAIASNYGGVEAGVQEFPQIRADNPYGMTIGFGSDATGEEVKAAMMYMEWCTQPEVLYELQHNDWNNYNNSKDFWCVTIESVKAATIEEAIGAIAPTDGVPEKFQADIKQQMIDNYYELRKIADEGHAYTDPAFSASVAAESEYNATLMSKYVEYYDKLVMCKPEEFDALYEQYSKEYLAAGYQAIIDERLELYKAGKTTKLPWNK